MFLPVLFCLIAAFPLFSQENHSGNGEPPSLEGASSLEGAASTENTLPAEAVVLQIPEGEYQLYVIVAYEFNVKGRSRPGALLYKLIDNGEFRKGETITGKTNLVKYISDITQIYTNQRVLKDNVEVNCLIGDQNDDGTYPVTITINVEDTWNIIAMPRPYYKNNVIDITIKARDYNFLGTMYPLRIDLGYSYNEDKRHAFLLGVFFDIPFNALGYYWDFTFDNTFQYRVDAPFYYQNETGISMELPFHSTTFTFGLNERFFLNEENSDWAKDNGYGPYQDGLYMTSNPYVSWRIPTGLTVSRYGGLIYTPRISSTFYHEFPKWPLDEFRKGPFLSFGHSLGFGKIDWHSNYREGLSFSMGNSYQYDFNQMIYDISFDFTGIGHFIISDFFAISSRLMYKYWYSSSKSKYGEYASSYIRGVTDSLITAYQMFSLNLDFPFRLFIFTPSKWFNSKITFFDFEMHASPIIDLAVYYQKDFAADGTTRYYPGSYIATGGLELVVFPAFMRNLYVRLGFAVNLKEFLTARPIKIPDGDNREIYLIMGHFY
ncbi:MAG: hypothetical protein LBU85_11390 [Treponema sp.]|nr:hypothetical protein [Treponema sp.]